MVKIKETRRVGSPVEINQTYETSLDSIHWMHRLFLGIIFRLYQLSFFSFFQLIEWNLFKMIQNVFQIKVVAVKDLTLLLIILQSKNGFIRFSFSFAK